MRKTGCVEKHTDEKVTSEDEKEFRNVLYKNKIFMIIRVYTTSIKRVKREIQNK